MISLFLKILNMSLTAGFIAAVVMLIRLILKRSPKHITVLLWTLVAVRLVCPYSPESPVSIVPNAEQLLYAPADTSTREAPPADTVPTTAGAAPALPTDNTENVTVITGDGNVTVSPPGSPADDPITEPPHTSPVHIAAQIWIAGMCAMWVWAAASCVRVRRCTREAILREKNIFTGDRISTPFIFGLFRPRIYLPSDISENDAQYVVAHERAHIARLDHIWKPVGFALLSVYWFNPLIWVSYILFCRDIETACDEKVLSKMGTDVKRPYSNALINCSAPRGVAAVCPLAFGEIGVRERIKHVLNYKKPTLYIVIAALAVCCAAAVCLLTQRPSKKTFGIMNAAGLDGISGNISSTQITYSDGDMLICSQKKNDAASLKAVLAALRDMRLDSTAVAPAAVGGMSERGYEVRFENKNGISLLTLHFSKDKSEVCWARDGGSFTDVYRIINKESADSLIDMLKGRGSEMLINGDTLAAPDDGVYSCIFATPVTLTVLRGEYPMYFGLDASDGLYVYVSEHICRLLNTPPDSNKFIFEGDKNTPGIPLSEMRAILASYRIAPEKIKVFYKGSVVSSSLLNVQQLQGICNYLDLPMQILGNYIASDGQSKWLHPTEASSVFVNYFLRSSIFETPFEELKRAHPDYFGIPTNDGLWVHVTQNGSDFLCTLTAADGAVPDGGSGPVSVCDMGQILEAYSIPTDKIRVVLHASKDMNIAYAAAKVGSELCLPDSAISVLTP